MSAKIPTVGIDLRPLQAGFKQHLGRGTGRYTQELFRELEQLPARPFKIRGLSAQELQASRLQHSVLSAIPYGKTTIETQLFLPRRLNRLGVELIHFCSHTDVPARCSVPYVVTVLDLIPLKFPELYRPAKLNWRYELARRLEEKAIRNAHAFLTISEASKRDIISLMGIASERIFVTPLAVAPNFIQKSGGSNDARNATRQQLNLRDDQPILLYVGGIDARKNVFFLLRCFRELLTNWRGPGRQPVLLLAGSYEQDRDFPKLEREIARLGLARDVVLLGYVPDEKLIDLYHAADAFLFPSLYEGFGLPVLEAMACGVPVIANNNSSIPEVAGDAAILVPDNDIQEWTAAIKALLSSRELANKLRVTGRARAQQFTWRDTAEKTIAVYDTLLSTFCDGLPRAGIRERFEVENRTAANE